MRDISCMIDTIYRSRCWRRWRGCRQPTRRRSRSRPGRGKRTGGGGGGRRTSDNRLSRAVMRPTKNIDPSPSNLRMSLLRSDFMLFVLFAALTVCNSVIVAAIFDSDSSQKKKPNMVPCVPARSLSRFFRGVNIEIRSFQTESRSPAVDGYSASTREFRFLPVDPRPRRPRLSESPSHCLAGASDDTRTRRRMSNRRQGGHCDG